ncbi:hypothetical protein AgCh_002016 [Apium graveolens]
MALREADLQKEVEIMNALTQTEKLKAEFLSKVSVEYETKEAQGLVALSQAQGTYVSILLKAVGGNYSELRDYLMINGGMYQEIAKVNSEAVRGLQPKISIWSNGENRGDENSIKGIGEEFKMLPPLFKTTVQPRPYDVLQR